MYKYILSINEYACINENKKIYTGDEVNNHIRNITLEENLPTWFMNNLIKPRLFKIQKTNLRDLLASDPSFNEYYNNGDVKDRYEDEDIDYNNINLELVVVDGELLDGYNRASMLLNSGEYETNAYVTIPK